MRKVFLVLSIVFTILSLAFSFLPLGTLAFLPIGLALIFIFLTFTKSNAQQRNLTKKLFVLSYICAAVVLVKTFLIKDEVAKDAAFEKQKQETKVEAKKELEDLEKDLK